MGFLTFLLFLLGAKGAGVREVGAASTLVFVSHVCRPCGRQMVCGFLV
jgi:hypothetical protein